jgi:hypothetical protein
MVRFKAMIGIAGCYVARRRRVPALCLLALGLVPSLPDKAKADYIFTRYDVPGSISTNLSFAGINDSGQIVGRYSDADGTNHGYLLSGIGGSFTTLDLPGANLDGAAGINASGQIVGEYNAGGTTHGFLRMSDGSYTTIDFAGATFTNAAAINGSGQVVGAYDAGGTRRGFLRMSDGSYATIDISGATLTAARGINAFGQIAGNYTADSISHGYLLSAGVYITFDVPAATATFVNGIDDSGQILGSYDAGGTRHGFLRMSDGSYTTIDVPGEPYTSALGINNSGQIVGTYIDAGGIRHGFVATPVPSFLITAAPTAVSGTPFDFTVTALDPYGNTDVNYQGTVTFSASDTDPGVLLPADYTFTTGVGSDNGVHTFPAGVTLVTPGDQTLTVTDAVSGIAGSVTVAVSPGP